MHIDARQLIALRDGEPVDASVVAHVQACARCSSALDELSKLKRALKNVPDDSPPPTLWNRIRALRELEVRAKPKRHGRLAAAVLVGVLAAGMLFYELRDSRPVSPASNTAELSLADIQRHSRELESLLQRYHMPAVMSVYTASAVTDIEDTIVLIDLQLDQPRLDDSQRRSLWQRRVELMEALMTVRAAERRANSI